MENIIDLQYLEHIVTLSFMSEKDFCNMCGISQDELNCLRMGKRESSIYVVYAIAEAVKVDFYRFFIINPKKNTFS